MLKLLQHKLHDPFYIYQDYHKKRTPLARHPFLFLIINILLYLISYLRLTLLVALPPLEEETFTELQ